MIWSCSECVLFHVCLNFAVALVGCSASVYNASQQVIYVIYSVMSSHLLCNLFTFFVLQTAEPFIFRYFFFVVCVHLFWMQILCVCVCVSIIQFDEMNCIHVQEKDNSNLICSRQVDFVSVLVHQSFDLINTEMRLTFRMSCRIPFFRILHLSPRLRILGQRYKSQRSISSVISSYNVDGYLTRIERKSRLPSDIT